MFLLRSQLFSYTAAFDPMKNVNRQAGYVTQGRVSGGLVIGLETVRE